VADGANLCVGTIRGSARILVSGLRSEGKALT
jgi:hypothetical protein